MGEQVMWTDIYVRIRRRCPEMAALRRAINFRARSAGRDGFRINAGQGTWTAVRITGSRRDSGNTLPDLPGVLDSGSNACAC
ncbi:hypothetical protein Q7O44_07780 [Shigella flexneri]|nr:hypothetical protein [Shigella flexneri]